MLSRATLAAIIVAIFVVGAATAPPVSAASTRDACYSSPDKRRTRRVGRGPVTTSSQVPWVCTGGLRRAVLRTTPRGVAEFSSA